MKNLNENDLNELIAQDKLTVIDFYTTWCAPCKAYSPIFEKVAGSYPDVNFGKLNIDENRRVAAKYSISSIPTTMFFKGGKPIEQFSGMAPENKLKSIIDRLL